jgi:chemotaxis protein MotB
MSDDSQRPIIVKRIKKNAAGHHGGAWKIAYADFVTAMMAFFLLMWLLGSTTKGDLMGISDYFKTPLLVAMSGGSGSGDSSSVLNGGGQDLTRFAGQVKRGDIEERRRTLNLRGAEAERARKEMEQLKALKEKVEAVIDTSPLMKNFKRQVLLDITSEGLRVQIVDEQNRPMFANGSAQVQPYMRDILHEIGKVLNEVPNRLSLSGHTDATPYARGERGYSNWELSADRANAARRELLAGGMQDARILRVVGLASAINLNHDDPFDPTNRRISIIVMNKKTEDAIIKDGEPAESARDGAKDEAGREMVKDTGKEISKEAVHENPASAAVAHPPATS